MRTGRCGTLSTPGSRGAKRKPKATLFESDEEQKFSTGAARSKLAHVRFDLISPIGLFFIAQRWAIGASKRGDHNWRKGMPYSAILAHMLNHITLYCLGDRSDNHMAAVAWGAFAIIDQDFTAPEQNDLWKFDPKVIDRVKVMLDAEWNREMAKRVPAVGSPVSKRRKARSIRRKPADKIKKL